MIRRTSTLLAALAGLGLASGCSTFTDSDVVARVGDAELTRDDLDDLVGDTAPELETILGTGGTPGGEGDSEGDDDDDDDDDGTIPGALAGRIVNFWIQSHTMERAIDEAGAEVTDADRQQRRQALEGNPNLSFGEFTPSFQEFIVDLEAANAVWTELNTEQTEFDAEAARTSYEEGMESSSLLCAEAIVTGTEGESQDAVSRIEGGADFSEVAAEASVQEQSVIGCMSPAEAQQNLPPEMLEAMSQLEVDPTQVTEPIELPGQGDTPLWVVLRHQPFADVSEQMQQMQAQQDQQDAQRTANEELLSFAGGVDVYVHPRYGSYSIEDGVQPLGQQPAADTPALPPG